MSSNCQVAGHCGHWHSAWRADFEPVCCWCGDTHSRPLPDPAEPDLLVWLRERCRLSDDAAEQHRRSGDRYSAGYWAGISDAFREVAQDHGWDLTGSSHNATTTTEPDHG